MFEFQLLNFTRATCKIHRTWFALRTKGSLDLYHLKLSFGSLAFVGKFPHRNGHISSGYRLSPLQTESSDGSVPIVVNVCAVCGKGIEYYRKIGTWHACVQAIMYELVAAVNGAYEEEKVLKLTRSGSDKDGKWND